MDVRTPPLLSKSAAKTGACWQPSANRASLQVYTRVGNPSSKRGKPSVCKHIEQITANYRKERYRYEIPVCKPLVCNVSVFAPALPRRLANRLGILDQRTAKLRNCHSFRKRQFTRQPRRACKQRGCISSGTGGACYHYPARRNVVQSSEG
jgi:hypothetical protein